VEGRDLTYTKFNVLDLRIHHKIRRKRRRNRRIYKSIRLNDKNTRVLVVMKTDERIGE